MPKADKIEQLSRQIERRQLDRLMAFAEEYVVAVLRQAAAKPHEELEAISDTLQARSRLLDVIEEMDDAQG